jgi:hypothetical protein
MFGIFLQWDSYNRDILCCHADPKFEAPKSMKSEIRSTKSETNPKHEIRNPKQVQENETQRTQRSQRL